ncbi:MAG: zinc-ribbon domain-containing protein [Anaerolineae bacterium]|jgi:predicted amidophosphoribosyltransferase
MAICPNCGNQTGEGAVFCDQCGTRLPEPEAVTPEAAAAAPAAPEAAPAGGSVICPTCGAGNVPGEAFCDYCGSPLEAPAPVTAPEEAAAAAEEEAVTGGPAQAEAPAEAKTVAPAAEETAPQEEPLAAAEEPGSEEPGAKEAALTCPACSAAVLPGEVFCSNCGASLAEAPIPPEPVAEAEPVAAPEEETVPEVAAPAPAAEETPPPAPAAPAPVPPAPLGLNCPACGAEIETGDAFCSACGYALQAPAAPPPPAVQASAAGPRLLVSASGAEIPLPAGDEFLVGREDPVSGIYPEIDLTPHGGEEGGVSRRHARIIVENGVYYVEDLDSTNFTFVNKQKLAPKTRQRIADGDEIRFGRVAVVFRT